jgi:hypothetical protein
MSSVCFAAAPFGVAGVIRMMPPVLDRDRSASFEHETVSTMRRAPDEAGRAMVQPSRRAGRAAAATLSAPVGYPEPVPPRD